MDQPIRLGDSESLWACGSRAPTPVKAALDGRHEARAVAVRPAFFPFASPLHMQHCGRLSSVAVPGNGYRAKRVICVRSGGVRRRSEDALELVSSI